MTKIRITCANNSDARGLDGRRIGAAKCKHNGGKVVIATVDDRDLDAVLDLLNEDNRVIAWETV